MVANLHIYRPCNDNNRHLFILHYSNINTQCKRALGVYMLMSLQHEAIKQGLGLND